MQEAASKPKRSKGRFLLVACAFAAIPSATAVAQTYVCPGGPGPGEVQMGVQNGPGFNGVPVCARDLYASDEGGYDGDDDGGYGGSYGGGDDGPRPSPAARALAAALEVERLMAERALARAELERDARYQRYNAGSWEYFQAPAGSCTAFFSRGRGFVAATTPPRGGANAYLTFWSPEIPRPRESALLRVALAQSGGDPPQTVTAINSFDPASRMGSVTIAVPDAAALLDNMLDAHQFALSLEGRLIAQAEWTGGYAARDQLRACL